MEEVDWSQAVLFIISHYNIIVMNPVLATVNINIGLGKNNPVLTIRKTDNLEELVNQLINQYQLPKNVHQIIMQRVEQ